jgi:dihydrofolate reductase
MISMIVAMDKNRTIGINNRLPWRLPADLAYFKRVTLGHTVIMGRKTYESIGKPLPGRTNIVLTRDKDYVAEGCTVCHSVDKVLKIKHNGDVFVIGGANIYNEFFNYADKLYVTLIDEEFAGDTFFNNISNEWKLISQEAGVKDEKNLYNYNFLVYERVFGQIII